MASQTLPRQYLAVMAAFALMAAFAVGLRAVKAAEDDLPLRGDEAAYREEGGRLFGYLARAGTEAEARQVEDEIWRYWFRAPDPTAASLMAQAMERRGNYDLAGAVEILDELVVTAPDWAEAWNQRATIRFMQGDFTGSLADVEETLQREPRHFGAMAGMALILTQQGRIRQAQAILREAVEIDPFLRERALIVEVPEKDI
ncbi:MAG: tetratricopeptide repeat protein [Bauldia sp.]|uniref:tetratricopeptide repeat protein n=1 Tax=Bauldia sp. TaxID=2575872 RepID=UPI001D27AFB8|nr:tetratricopeptide repeat protein [Bauldia sp.]MCB1496104.1 tetratricopeptide repeat protein [Bauldia sp.]